MENQNYEDRMLEAFIQTPEKSDWYKNAFSKYSINGVDKISWVWSWWAFFGGFWFPLYRKSYMPALGLFIISIIAGVIPLIGLIIAILAGGYTTYFIYKTYQQKKLEIETKLQDPEQRIEAMQQVGGYHQWVIWINIVLGSIVILGILTAIILPAITN